MVTLECGLIWTDGEYAALSRDDFGEKKSLEDVVVEKENDAVFHIGMSCHLLEQGNNASCHICLVSHHLLSMYVVLFQELGAIVPLCLCQGGV